MNERLEQFLAAENITQAAFADKIKVARASVSHILSGRNRPGYEFFANLIKNYPALNIEWLITGKGRMYKEIPSYSRPADLENHRFTSVNTLFDTEDNADDTPLPANTPAAQEAVDVTGKEPDSAEVHSEEISRCTHDRQRKAKKIIVFYDDGTFEEFQK